MLKKNHKILLFILTLLFILVSAITIQRGYFSSHKNEMEMDNDDNDRNENSTPRSFILPAAPAVAEEQDRKKIEIFNEIKTNKCMSKLNDMGYAIDDFDTSFNAKFTEAILNYQEKMGLRKTGILDKETRVKIGCN
jgi:Putative peptidoglycan binding domain